MHRFRVQWRSGLLAAAAVVAFAITSGAGASGEKSAATGTAIVRLPGDYVTLDYQRRATSGVFPYSYPLFDRLVGWNKTNDKVVPYLATSWVVTPKDRPKQVVFTMRRDAKCGDGTPVTPSVVKASFDRYVAVPKISNQLSRWYGKGPYTTLANNKNWTFTFKTQTPFAHLVEGFAIAGGILCPAALQAAAADVNALGEKIDPSYGSGPYTLESASHNNQVVYKKNPNWKWGPPGSDIRKMPDTLIYKFFTDETTAANVLLTGGLDVAAVAGPDTVRLNATKSLQHKIAFNHYFVPMTFNQNPGRITTELAVRRALMAAVNLADYNKVAFPGAKVVGSGGFFAPTDPCYDKTLASLVPTGGPARAKAIMQAAGWSPNANGILTKGGKEAHILVLSSDQVAGGGQYWGAQFKAAGFDVDLKDLASNIYSPQYVSSNFDVAVSYSFTYTPFPDIGTLHGASRFANIGGADQEWERTTLFAEQRTDCKYWYEAQRVALKKAVLLPAGLPSEDSYGNKSWDFPAAVKVLEVEWLTHK